MKMNLIKNIKLVVCWILFLQLINISINPPDLQHPKFSSITNKEDLTINKIESVYELIVEGVSDEEVPESDEDETDTTSQSFVLYFFSKICSKLPALNYPIEHFSHYHNNFPSVTKEAHFPPPKFA
jgi:hypothetical protein